MGPWCVRWDSAGQDQVLTTDAQNVVGARVKETVKQLISVIMVIRSKKSREKMNSNSA